MLCWRIFTSTLDNAKLVQRCRRSPEWAHLVIQPYDTSAAATAAAHRHAGSGTTTNGHCRRSRWSPRAGSSTGGQAKTNRSAGQPSQALCSLPPSNQSSLRSPRSNEPCGSTLQAGIPGPGLPCGGRLDREPGILLGLRIPPDQTSRRSPPSATELWLVCLSASRSWALLGNGSGSTILIKRERRPSQAPPGRPGHQPAARSRSSMRR
jgi:hypothetical protein